MFSIIKDAAIIVLTSGGQGVTDVDFVLQLRLSSDISSQTLDL